MNPQLVAEIKGLKCDNPDCDWKDEEIDFTSTDKYINMPCPKCGENVLTAEDYTNTLVFMKAVEITNIILPGAETEGERTNLKVDLHQGIKITMPDGEILEPLKNEI